MAKSKVSRASKRKALASRTKRKAFASLRKWARVYHAAETRERKAEKVTAADPRPMDAQTTKDLISCIHDDLFAETNALRCLYLALEAVPEVNTSNDLGAAQDLLSNSTQRINSVAERLDSLWMTLPKEAKQ